MSAVAATTLQQVQQEARTYPGYLLSRGGTGLALFAAGFHGRNDAIHFVRHNMTGHCVDIDETKLREMEAVYPRSWSFTHADAFEFAEQMATFGAEWDVVSVDTFLGGTTERSLEMLDLWSLLARDLVTVTVPVGVEPDPPEGWSASVFSRSDRASWLVLRRD